MELYEKIQVLRKAKGLSQSQLAERIDVTRQSVQKWESGATAPDIYKLPELAVILGVTTDLLLDAGVTQEDLMHEVLSRQNPAPPAVAASNETAKPDKQRRSMLDWLILVPVLLGAGICIFMFYAFGGMAIGFGFLFTLFSPIAAVWSFVAIFLNIGSGAGAVLVCVGGTILGLGAGYPLFILSVWWLKKYKLLAAKLTAKLKKFDIRSI